ncbi:DUF1593-domain-containing protein [Phyllosticta paracitricarpa]|uniref:DUF1593-domain-containing protein n=1 Tax=Phyllosticta paracitricarpa TaxID=2016321 RepID=A0ABR1N0P7_9PEZI
MESSRSLTRRALLALVLLFSLCINSVAALTTTGKDGEGARYENKHRVFVLTDISNEPDDQMSLVRLLVHSNEIQIEGIAAITSVWLNYTTDLDTIHHVINTYSDVVENLNANVPEAGKYPTGEELLSKTYTGHPVYGLAAIGANYTTLSNASVALINATDASEERLWVSVWGGANVLAEALNHVEKTRSAEELASFLSKLHVYSISDQDDAGPWIREKFPKLFYIVSLHGFSEYSQAAWIGISGEHMRSFDVGGPDSSLVTNEWLEKNVRLGELGKQYPEFEFIMEGDTPAFLSLIPNGLTQPEYPQWGGWGGRYINVDSSGRSLVFSNTADYVVGLDNQTHASAYATIWRWRKAFQYDFAARMAWAAYGNDTTKTNHHPVAIVNGSASLDTIKVPYRLGESLVLDASESWDPDNDDLTFSWYNYREASIRIDGGEVPHVSPNVTITPLNDKGSVVELLPKNNLTLHIILTVEDVRKMNLATYRRVILEPEA